MSIFLVLLVPVVLVFLFAVFRGSRPVGQWTDAELQRYLNTNSSRRHRLMLDGMFDPAKRRAYEALDGKCTEVEQEWERRLTAPKKIDSNDLQWLEARKSFVADAAKALGVSEQEAGRQIIERRKTAAMRYAGFTSTMVDRMVLECFTPENIEAQRKDLEFNERIANLQRKFISKGLDEDLALNHALAEIRAQATEQKEAEEQKRAEQGDAEAQFVMGEKALAANDLDTALEWFHNSADQGHVKAAKTILSKSRIRPISDERRQALIEILAKAGDAMWQCTHAEYLLKKGENSQARQWLEQAAAKNHHHGLYLLGKLLEEGGNGIEKDHAAALDLYFKAANQGSGYAQMRLASCYETGYGVPQDMRKAYMWYTIAAKLFLFEAYNKREEVIKRMSPSQLEEAKALVVAWHEQAQLK